MITTFNRVRIFLSSFFSRYPLAFELITAPLVLGLVFIVAAGSQLRGDKSIATFQDNTHFLLPLFNHISKSFSQGEFPYWINTIAGGIPLYSTPQFSILYPFYFFRSGLYANPVDALYHTHYITLLHIFIGQLAMYSLLRILRLAPLPSVLGASIFAFNANTYSYSVWVNILAPYMWFPVIVAGLVLIFEERSARWGTVIGALSLSLLILASPAQPLIHATYTIAVLYLFHLVTCVVRRSWGLLRRSTLYLCMMGLLTLSLASPMLIPTLIGSKAMIRFVAEYGSVVGFEKIPFEGFLIGQAKVSELAAVMLPIQMNTVIGESFVGMGAVLLALFALFRIRSNWIVLPLALIGAYALVASAGSNLGLAYINYRLPLINKIREPGRHLFLFVFSASVLAAFGFSYLTTTLKRGSATALRTRHVLMVLVFFVFVGLAYCADLPYKGEVSKWTLLVILVVQIALLLALGKLSSWGSYVAQAGMIGLVVFTAMQYPWPVPRIQDGDYFSEENLKSHRTLKELAALNDNDYRFILDDQKFSSQYWSMNASYYGLRTFQAFMNPLPSAKQFDEVFQRFGTRNYYPMLGAKYYVCNPCNEQLIRDYSFQRDINGYALYLANNPMPRVIMVNRIAGGYSGRDDFLAKADQGFDYLHEVYLTSEDEPAFKSWIGNQTELPDYVLKNEGQSLNHLRLSVNSKSRGILVFNEYYNNDWKVKVNGVPISPLRVNLNQIGIPIMHGGSLVEIEYRPTLFIVLLWIQYLTLVCIAAFMVYVLCTKWGWTRKPVG